MSYTVATTTRLQHESHHRQFSKIADVPVAQNAATDPDDVKIDLDVVQNARYQSNSNDDLSSQNTPSHEHLSTQEALERY